MNTQSRAYAHQDRFDSDPWPEETYAPMARHSESDRLSAVYFRSFRFFEHPIGGHRKLFCRKAMLPFGSHQAPLPNSVANAWPWPRSGSLSRSRVPLGQVTRVAHGKAVTSDSWLRRPRDQARPPREGRGTGSGSLSRSRVPRAIEDHLWGYYPTWGYFPLSRVG